MGPKTGRRQDDVAVTLAWLSQGGQLWALDAVHAFHRPSLDSLRAGRCSARQQECGEERGEDHLGGGGRDVDVGHGYVARLYFVGFHSRARRVASAISSGGHLRSGRIALPNRIRLAWGAKRVHILLYFGVKR
jgi:hypothetical protein